MRPLLALLAVAFCFTSGLTAQKKDPYGRVTGDVRLEAIRSAQVWSPVDISSRNIKEGPRGQGAFSFSEEVTCEYKEDELRGTPKFNCVIPPDDEIRVKFGEHNGEVYAEVAATRLLWALGFPADRIYPVRVTCEGCPEDPVAHPKKEKGSRQYEAAVIERKFDGDEIELRKDTGWSWVELSFVDQTAGGAPLAQRDALKLLAAFMQHTDNKPQQQRLMCVDREKGLPASQDGSCQHPVMMVNDVGKTFGRASMTNADAVSAVNFDAWSNTPVWRFPTGCVAQLDRSFTGSLEHPEVGEEGRAFLASLLSQLSDRQLHDLFEVAQFTKRDPKTGIDDWVRAFKAKREEVATRRCGEGM